MYTDFETEEIYGVLEPFTVNEEFKNELKIDPDYSDDDGLLTRLIVAARLYCERYTGLSLKKKTYIVYFASSEDSVWSRVSLQLPFGPTKAENVVAVHYLDSENEWVEIEPSDFRISGFGSLSVMPRQYIVVGPYWHKNQPYRVVYESGYEYGALPEDIAKAMMQLIGDLYENRNNSAVSSSSGVGVVEKIASPSTKQLLAGYRKKTLF